MKGQLWRNLTARETATILAALRMFQETKNATEEMAEHFAFVKPLGAKRIDALCETINLGNVGVLPERVA